MESESIECVHFDKSVLYFCMDPGCVVSTQTPVCHNCFLVTHPHDTILLRKLTQNQMHSFNLGPLRKKKLELAEIIRAKSQKLRELVLEKIEKKQYEQFAKLNSILPDDIGSQSNGHTNNQNNLDRQHVNNQFKSLQTITSKLDEYERELNAININEEFQQFTSVNERKKSGNYKRVKISKPIPQEKQKDSIFTYPVICTPTQVYNQNNSNVIEIEAEEQKYTTIDDFEKAQSFVKDHPNQVSMKLILDLKYNRNPRKNLTSFLNSLRILTKLECLEIQITKQCKIGEWNLTQIDDILCQLVKLKQCKLSYYALTQQAIKYRYEKCNKIAGLLGKNLNLEVMIQNE